MNKYEYSKEMSAEEAYNEVKRIINEDLLKKFSIKGKIDHNDSKQTIAVDGKGFGLNMQFSSGYLEYDLKLSLMLKPLKGKVVEGLEAQLKKVL